MQDEYDYIVVGSGAGGGPLAANLAKAGFCVLLLEAGGDSEPPNYAVPAFHPFATEDPALKWDYFVRHYENNDRSQRDDKFVTDEDGVLYPRAGTLGGCTAHHAMITVYPHDRDWDEIAQVTDDKSWSAANMRLYFQRLERKENRLWSRFVYRLTGRNIGRRGYDGWLPVSFASPTQLLGSPRLLRLVLQAGFRAHNVDFPGTRTFVGRLLHLFATARNLNDWAPGRAARRGVKMVPVSIFRGRRWGVRELLRETMTNWPERLHVELHALACSVVFEDVRGEPPRAVGVRYLKGQGLYAAGRDGDSAQRKGVEKVAHCRREVVLAAGAFNTPQLLMLSGIGPEEELRKHNIRLRVHRPGVGRNLQDRYEACVVTKMKRPFRLLQGAKFRAPQLGEAPDPLYAAWMRDRGPYTTNGAVLAVVRHSKPVLLNPDLCCFGLVGDFRGYFPDYSRRAVETPAFTWAVLKAHTENRGGRVSLASADPCDRPVINFHYFDEGTGDAQADLEAVVEGIRFCRDLNRAYGDLIAEELVPGPGVDTDDEIARFVRDNAWGHHASCSCPIGALDDPNAVVDRRFRVIGTEGLRIVDASVFPRIPGFFIALPIYMISEKAADVMIAEARQADAASGA